MSFTGHQKGHTEIARKYPYSEYTAIPKSFQLLSEATVLHDLLGKHFGSAGHVNAEFVREYLEKNEGDRNIFLECWKRGNFDEILSLDGIRSMRNFQDTASATIQGGTFKEVHGDSYEIGEMIIGWTYTSRGNHHIDDFEGEETIIESGQKIQEIGFSMLRDSATGYRVPVKNIESFGARVYVAGAGKTTISSLVINHLQTRGHLVCYVYFDYKRQKEQSSSLVLGSIARQLYQQVPHSRETFRGFYKKYKDEHPRENVLETLLREVTHGLTTPVYIVLDALDEYFEQYRATHISHLVDLVIGFSDKIRLMVTSRVLGGMEDVFQARGALRMEIMGTSEDIGTYVALRVREEIPFAQRILSDIVEAVLKASETRFLPAMLHMNHLCSLLNTGEIRDALEELSSDIDDAYATVLERINGQSAHCKHLALRALAWVALSLEPMTEIELQEALATAPGRKELDDYITPIDSITAVCAGLLVTEQQGMLRLVKFIHMTAFEFFQRNSAIQQFGHSFCVHVCMDHILAKLPFNGSLWPSRGFLGYATRQWGFHARLDEKTLLRDILSFLRNDERVTHSLTQGIPKYPANFPYYCRRWGLYDNTPHHLGDVGSPLHLAAYFCLPMVLKILLSDGLFVNERTAASLTTPLSIAAAHGDLGIAQVLLSDPLADLGIPNWDGISPLMLASCRGDEELVDLFLNHPTVCSDQKDSQGWNALFCASTFGHDLVVEKLLISGAQYDNLDDCLTSAARESHEAVVDILLEAGANPISASSSWLLTHHPAFDNSIVLEKIFSMYPEAAQICSIPEDNHGRYYGAADGPFFSAALFGHHNVVKLLLQLRLVSPSGKNKDGFSAISLAFRGGHSEIADTIFRSLLLQNNGTFSEGRDLRGKSDLAYAAEAGLGLWVEKLILTGLVDVNHIDGDGRSPISYAAGRKVDCEEDLAKSLKVVQILTQYGARWDNQDTEGLTPLSHAAAARNADIVDLLLEMGSDPNIVDTRGNTPLLHTIQSWAIDWYSSVSWLTKCQEQSNIASSSIIGLKQPCESLKGVFATHDRIVASFVGYGANINFSDAEGCTPLSHAARASIDVLLEILLKHGADINQPDEGGRPPITQLIYFSRRLIGWTQDEQLQAMDVLIGYGANVNLLDKENRSALSYAAAHSRSETHLKSLLVRDTNVNSTDWHGRTPLWHAAAAGRTEFVRILLDHGVNVNQADLQGCTPLMAAAERGRPSVITALIRCRLLYGQRYFDPVLPLHHSFYPAKSASGRDTLVLPESEWEKTVELLLHKGAEIFSRDVYGNSLSDRAFNWQILRDAMEVVSSKS